jgi:NAD(P)-dependent dehydrogenase (short-subunit alcohol dehydrogenase family)
MTKEWPGKVVIITGGALGIGRAAALEFARRGARVVVADVQVDAGKETIAAIDQQGGEAIFVETDVSQPDQVEALIQKTVDTYGRLDCAFNNAGIEGELAPTAESSEENWHRVISINLTGVWLSMKYEIAQMLRQGGGAIVNMSSIAGLVGTPHVPAYSAAKHGVLGLTKTAALEYATQGIRVNAVCPGAIDTAMIKRFTAGEEELYAQLAQDHPLQRLGTPEEVAAAVVWLCSDEAAFVTGHALAIDGGYVVQ